MSTSPAHEHPASIAIIGMAARLPGARNITEYWRNLREGVESIVSHTREEMLARGARPDLVDDPCYVNASAPLEDHDCFDAAFFGYSAREASIMDPQHRIFLECAYHALEDAGYDSRRYRGLIGVYAGCTMNTYLLHNVMAHADDTVAAVGDLQTMVGNDKDYLTTRVSHKLDLRGPSLAVQTACSTSLVAIHLACRALLDDECDMALAGGASVRLPHGAGYLANPGGTSSPDGHCRAFDADAAGSVVGNGVGVVVLKRLADALRDRDQIYAVIRGSAINNDGQVKASFTAPSVDGQSRAVKRALERAGVSARDIQFVEAHGTGTPLGDPIEVAALTRAFRHWTDDTGYCWLGSVKPNIGHLDAAAGVAGLIKAVLALKHRLLPPVVNFRRPNPKLELDTTPFVVPTELVRLEADEPLRASVNSLAMGGTNAHVVLEEAPAVRRGGPSRSRQPVLLSARSAEALEAMSQALGQWARENPAADVADVAYTLATGRRELEYRRVLLARDLDDVGYGLSARGSRRQREAKARGSVRTAFLFPGQGAQRLGMGARLAEQDPVFARHLQTVFDLFRDAAGLDLRSVLYPGSDEADAARARLAETQLTQPALFAVEWALGRTLFDYGVRPYAMLGHSVGELVAATLAGVLSLPDAVEVVALRCRLMSDTAEGAMLYANLSPAEAAERLAGGALAIAAVNSDRLVVLSGPVDAIERVEQELRVDGVPCGRLEVTRAFHSPAMEPAAAKLGDALHGRKMNEPSSLVVSNVTGEYLTAEQATSPEYWADQVRRTVRFADGLQTLVRDGVTVFLEVGPGRSLSGLAQAATRDATCLPVLDNGSGEEMPDLLEVLTGYWLEGGEVDWAAYYEGEERSRISLPGYPFARTRHWLDPKPYRAPRPAAPVGPERAAVAPAPAAASATRAERAPNAGRTPMQRYLTQLWHKLLGTEEIGLHDNFFELGGHSLLAMQLVTHLRKDIAADIAMTALFETPTVAGLAEYLESIGGRAPAIDDEVPGEATPGDDRPPGHPSESPAEPDMSDEDVAALVAEIESLSDEEVRARLAELDSEEDR